MDHDSPTTADATDELLPRVAAGDAGAFAALFRRWRGHVYRFALHMTGSPSTAEDVAQDVFLTAMHEAGRYEVGRSTEIAWLCGIARNQVRRRMDRRGPSVSLSDAGAEDDQHLRNSAAPDGLTDLLRSEQIEAVRRAVASLPVRYREVVVLCDLQELSYREAAIALECAVGTVRSRLSRGRSLLASKLGVTVGTGAEIDEEEPHELGVAARRKLDARGVV